MKILYITPDKQPIDLRANKISVSLKELGYDVAILCRNLDKPDEYFHGIKFFQVPLGFSFLGMPFPNNPLWMLAINNAVKEFKPDLIIVREIMLAIDSAIFAKKFNIPIIMDMADNYPVLLKNKANTSHNPIMKYLTQRLNLPEKIEKKSVALMNGIITVCDEQNERLNSQYDYPSDEMEVVHNTPKKEWFASVKTGILLHPTVFAYHGMITQDRNLENLLTAFDIAWKTNNNIKLIIAGYGDAEVKLKNYAKTLESTENISFRGRFVQAQMKNLLSEMDFGILPYKINEHINQTITNRYFDYMGAGKPMITSAATPMIRLNNETQAGIDIDCENCELLAETILLFANDNNYNLMLNISNSAIYAFTCHYSWDRDMGRLNTFIKRKFAAK